MSFRSFIYYCAVYGGWAALAGWGLGRILSPENPLGQSGIRGLFLGVTVAAGLGLVDAVWELSTAQMRPIILRVGVALLVGGFGGLVGGMLGQLLLDSTHSELFFVLGWTISGMLVGASVTVFELLSSVVRRQNISGAAGKLLKCVAGGTVGGLIGGSLAVLLKITWERLLRGKGVDGLWSPTAMGFVALGTCIGLMVGLAQVVLKEAWLRVEAGVRPGREMILVKETTTIGRAESCDLGLFGDKAVENLHACILLTGNRYYVEDAGTPAGTYVNDQRVAGRMPLKPGDLIRLGKSMLRFNEREKRTSET